MFKPLRILYAVGSEDAIEAYHYWRQGEDATSQFKMSCRTGYEISKLYRY
ncbi:hypothetical protein [Scytonema sp. NUACC26]